MPIRLSKACKELNIGITTAVDFLAKKGNKIAVDPNLKLSDELHLLLVKEFNKDMALKMESERISQERHQKEKASTVALEGYGAKKTAEKAENIIPVEVPVDQLPSIKQVGKIDLDAINKKPEPIKPEPVVQEPVKTTEPVEELKVVEKEEVEIPVVNELVQEPVEIVQEAVAEEHSVEVIPEINQEVEVSEQPEITPQIEPVVSKEVDSQEEEKQVVVEKEQEPEVESEKDDEDEVFSIARPEIGRASCRERV